MRALVLSCVACAVLSGCSLLNEADEYTFRTGAGTDAGPRDGTTEDGGGDDAGIDAGGDAGVIECRAPMQECDGNLETICETDTATSNLHCGGCGTRCGGTCMGGTCAVSGVSYVAAGYNTTCVRTFDGGLACFGLNLYGQLGRGDTAVHDDIARVDGITVAGADTGVVQPIAVGASHACAISRDGRLYCWGSHTRGQLGTGVDTASTAVPVLVAPPGLGWTHVAAGGTEDMDAFTCGVNMGQIYCWGDNAYGQLGTGMAPPASLPTASMLSTTEVVELAAGGAHACALIGPDGEVWCWGSNTWGQIGDGTTANRQAPIRIVLPGPAAAIAAGREHTCAWLADGRAYCWGNDAEFQIGEDYFTDPMGVHSPAEVEGLPPAATYGHGVLAAADRTTYAISEDHAYAWGGNGENQLGSSMAMPSLPVPTPVEIDVPVAAGMEPRQIAAGAAHACTVHANGALYCWGANANKQAVPEDSGATALPQAVVVP